MGAIVDSWNDNHFRRRCAVGPALQGRLWSFTYARSGRALGNSGADSNAWRVLHGRNWSTRDSSFVCDHGRPWRQFACHVSPALTVLFRDCLRQFLSVVDQVAMAGSKITTGAKSRRQRPWLQRKINRQVSRNRHRHHFHHLYLDQNEVASLHLTGFSAARAFACAALATSGDGKPSLLA